MFDILQYLPCPWGVVALRGIQNQGFYFFEVANQGYNFFYFGYFLTKCWQFQLRIVIFTGFKVPPRAVRWMVSACGASATSEKTRPWNFGACILWILSFFNDFRVPLTTPWSMSPKEVTTNAGRRICSFPIARRIANEGAPKHPPAPSPRRIANELSVPPNYWASS